MNELILRTVTAVVTFMIILFGIQLFFAGHYYPGGGFIAGLVTAGAIILLLLAFDIKTVRSMISVSYRTLIGVGLLFALGTGLGGLVFDVPFLTHAHGHVMLPLLGDVSLHTAVLFDLGVYLVVVGVTMTIIETIGEDE
ncbi:Na(+)/H(+) antiporter subunit B [Geobacillus sp. FSL K6-0789]|uniref:Na(+) H(+) antiporter subunit B n=1 Tax=Geobacillus stearothermophilus TaxID=1422 RepID=A0A0K9HKK0_GEOSE|nr:MULTISPECIES: Na(+)/H(+) antiporter subunit B [Geobacillus]KAF6510640.1 Na(+) H(+) antiporter subunit B [Geobacillus stearothermophilus]KMY58377.1 monovalent cation/H+ antiporter subunit B [Geobacillus stearothermophilus]KMY59374.1 monovalent cation/H+ antiporter subunit B [Geobacillus stearothermophilus]KMY63940.1 monovalent cation/H+ antiporter subunit B [Geobacillus stearothermophilus]MBR2516237.1 Na(+)/H(+) antiporter subunit B [Geobacillus sp.]